jgi:hypothetical protein
MAERKSNPLTRRAALRLIAAAPIAAAAARSAIGAEQGAPKPEAKKPPEAPPKPSAYAKFISKDEPDLSGDERSRLRKQMPGLEGALKKLRDFDLSDDAEPAFTFSALPPGLRGKR